MLKVDNVQVFNLEGALRGLRNPKNSWKRSDSSFGVFDMEYGTDSFSEVAESYDNDSKRKVWLSENGISSCYVNEGDYKSYNFIGKNDLKLAQAMIGAGTDESKFMRQIFISMDITAPLYWWKEFDTYKVGTVANSCSTMHKLAETPITVENFSLDNDERHIEQLPADLKSDDIEKIIDYCEFLRKRYVETGNRHYWRALIQILPEGWMQRRTVTLNYQVARAIYFARKNHKVIEWIILCRAFEHLPYGKDLICYERPKKFDSFTTSILTKFNLATKEEIDNFDKCAILNRVLDLEELIDKIKEKIGVKGEKND